MENIQVGLRVRPLNPSENKNFEKNPWVVKSANSIAFDCEHFENVVRGYKTSQMNLRAPIFFNNVFDENAKNSDIYEKMVEDVVNSSLEGINGTVFMYGQTGGGKTFTMLGTMSDPMKTPAKNPSVEGIILYAIRGIFNKIEEVSSQQNISIKCSYLEIYNDLLYDLLANEENLGSPLAINQDLNKDFFIPECREEKVGSFDEVIDLVQKGEAKRHYASTVLNHVSSRSHTIFRLFIRNVSAIPGDISKDCVKESILNFVDLAGSEKLHYLPTEKTPSQRFKESQHINKSLFFLTSVISLISQGKKEIHIPYRNSPLTKILKGALGGNSRTRIILCLNPCLSQLEQSLNTVRFGLCAKKIQNPVKINCFMQKKRDNKENFLITYTETKHEKRRPLEMVSDQKLRRALFPGPSIEDLELRNKELNIENKIVYSKNKRISKKMKILKKTLKSLRKELIATKAEKLRYEPLLPLISGQNIRNLLANVPQTTLEAIEGNLSLALDQVKLMKFFRSSEANSATSDSLRGQFFDILEQRLDSYCQSITEKRRIPCDLLNELERTQLFGRKNIGEGERMKELMGKGKNMSMNEGNEENLLSNVSNMMEERFEIENILE